MKLDKKAKWGLTSVALMGVAGGAATVNVTAGKSPDSFVRTLLKSGLQLTKNLTVESAHATSTSSAMDAIRSGVGFVIGYREHADYVKYACGGDDPGEGNECDGPPRDGLAGMVVGIAQGLPEMLESKGYETCEDVPSSGEDTLDDDGEDLTVTYSEGSLPIPEGWAGGGETFDKRVTFDGSNGGVPFTLNMEFSCEHKVIGVATIMDVGTHAPDFKRGINVFIGQVEDSDEIRAQVFVSEQNPTASTNRGSYAFLLSVNEEEETFKLWGSYSGHYNNGSQVGADYIAANGKFTGDRAMSVYYRRHVFPQISSGSSGYNDMTTLATYSGANDDSVTAVSGYDLSSDLLTQTTAGTKIERQGCVQLDSNTMPTSATLCDGQELENPPEVPVLDASGNWAYVWAGATMYSKLLAID